MSKKAGGNILSSLHDIKAIHSFNFSKSFTFKVFAHNCWKKLHNSIIVVQTFYSNMVELQQGVVFETKHDNHESLTLISSHH